MMCYLGRFPEKYNEVVLMVDDDGRISDYTLYALGLKDVTEVNKMFESFMKGEKVEPGKVEEFDYDTFVGLEFKLLLNTDYYVKENGIWIDKSADDNYMKEKLNSAETIKVVGIIKPNDQSNITSSTYGEIGYLKDLTEYVIDKVNNSEIAKEQTANQEINVFTGTGFTEASKAVTGTTTFSMDTLTDEQKYALSQMSEEEQLAYISAYSTNVGATYEKNLELLGVVNLEEPIAINIFPKSFEAKDNIKEAIGEYNKKQEDNDKKENVIEYTDIVGVLMNSVTKIVNVISYVLIAFVAISLVVSSIMIGIITYISVLERTKEIGILRAIGASKKDISRVFNAETFIIGLTSGAIGIIITVLLNIPINIVINHITGITSLSSLPILGGVILILISMILTVIAGLVPAKIAAKKDPVDALRTE